MKMRFVKGTAAVFLVCIMVLSFVGAFGVKAANETDKITYNRYNIVLVGDASGSMNSTDESGLRFEAIGKFIALLAERGNRVGTVVFNGDIAYKQELTDADGIAIKRGFLENIQKIPAAGYTNIGKGLKTATEMLDKDKNADLPSIILLLSDGNTDLATKDEKTLSLEQKADAIQSSRDSGYKIYTVSLNADGSANSDELAQIAKATGGQFQEVKNAGDLEDVFSMYYSLIFSSKLNKDDEKTFPDSGIIDGTFEIPTVGVEEVNIVLSGKASDYSFIDPADKPYSKNDMAAFTYSSNTFNVVKIVDPLAGEWKYQVKGIPGDKIQINIVYNTNLSSGIKITPQKDVYMANDKITINAFLTEAGQNAQVAQYSGFTASLSVTDDQGNTQAYDMTLGSDGFDYVFAPPKSGTYTVRANIVGQEYNIFTDNIKLNVDNTPPTANKDIEETVLLWPFSDNKKGIDLTPGATDAQDSTLRYEVESTAFNENEYTLSGGELTMNSYSLTKGSFAIRAYDSDGAYCTFNVLVNTVNMTLLGIILLVGGILIAAVIIGIGLWIALNKRFMGACYVTQFDEEGNYYEEVKREEGRGRISLSAFNLKEAGFNTSKCYFQATGKDHVFFVTDEQVHGDGKVDKKFRIDGNGYEVTISTDELAQRGIRVKFVSRLNNTNYSF
ncbi:hypothetical protein Hs30E_10620 [Lactococcus hodotermopsidis]|uniref:VWFA domain-containing protein n=1 Tax=Pseudolactococcus hodotermopsidis TaxID=2709157 RepID=A0A6A0BDS2_9LACT|nr:vWA domain-containing protein [Lactococcus hodotermopsidis]GFH42511.1 hypothetical protein Hs30E_10620 [Lactococcus hodotermopsidis]